MANYYNDFDPKVCAWLRELIAAGLIPQGDVDERSIADVRPSDLTKYDQCHFFCGVAGWPLALGWAGLDQQPGIWTGSCPCQPFSSAGKRKGQADERHLWPEFARLIGACRPQVVFGEQVASTEVLGTGLEADFVAAVSRGDCAAANRLAKRLVRSKQVHWFPRWIDGVFADLEGFGYACRANDIPAAGVGSPHIRQRLFWVADADKPGLQGHARHGDGINQPGRVGADAVGSTPASGELGRLADSQRQRTRPGGEREQGREGQRRDRPAIDGDAGWSSFDIITCRDGKSRRIERQPEPLADGVPALVDALRDAGLSEDQITAAVETWPLVEAQVGRAMLLKGYGNAIVPQVAVEFILAWKECQ